MKTPASKRGNSGSSEPSTPHAHVEFSLELKKIIHERNILTTKTRKRVFEALDEIKTKSDEESRQFKREKAVLEIISSEKNYVRQLEIIIHFFMTPAQERKLLKIEDFETLFGNIISIYNVNKQLLEELEKGAQNVVAAFSKIGPFLKMYSVYASEFKKVLQLLQNSRALYPQFSKFVENQETRPEVQSKLSALLITPIQRVPRYKLLLMHLVELTKPFEEEYDRLTECLLKIDEAAEHINKVVEDHENTQRLLELQRYFRSGEPNVIKPGRKLIKEGILIKMSTKKGPKEKLYIVLMNDIMMFNKIKSEEPVNSLKCVSIFPLGKCRIVEVLDKGCMKIVCQDEELILYHDELSETKIWIATIRDAIESHLNDRKTLRKDSSSRRPVKRKDILEYHEVGLSPGRPMKKRRVDQDNGGFEEKPSRISKRRPIHQTLFDSTLTNHPKADMSVPTTNDLLNGVHEDDTSASQNLGNEEVMSKDLFVFGKPHPNSSFTFGKLLGGVSSSIKRIFGFKT
nr:unnamed protein product [Callosobruchus chinensis]